MVFMKLLQEKLQPWCEPALKFLRCHVSFAEFRSRGVERAAELAEHVMPIEPKTGHLTEIGMRQPLLARILVEQEPQISRPAKPGVEV